MRPKRDLLTHMITPRAYSRTDLNASSTISGTKAKNTLKIIKPNGSLPDITIRMSHKLKMTKPAATKWLRIISSNYRTQAQITFSYLTLCEEAGADVQVTVLYNRAYEPL